MVAVTTVESQVELIDSLDQAKDMLTSFQLEEVPSHVALILDGNRRWARAKGLPAAAGHAEGAERIEPIVDLALNLGVRTLTLFMFSTENWKRSQNEIDTMFSIMAQYLQRQLLKAKERNLRLRFIGELASLPSDFKQEIARAQEATAACTGMTILCAINYGGRNDILRAVQGLAKRVKEGSLDPEAIREWHLSEALDTHTYGDPQLIIRTSGEQRISNFLLWQLAYSELYFAKVKWPEFTPEHFVEALQFYQTRQRRFGV